MRLFPRVLCAVLGSFVLFASPVDAALVSLDWKAPGDGLLTLDTESGLRWLDVSESNRISSTLLVAGSPGVMESFRYATTTEVLTLYANVGLSGNLEYVLEEYSPALLFVSFFNTAVTTPSSTFATGYLPGPDGARWLMQVGIGDGAFFGVRGLSSLTPTDTDLDLTLVPYGHVLVQTVPYVAPIPDGGGMLALLGIAAAGLRFVARQRGLQDFAEAAGPGTDASTTSR